MTIIDSGLRLPLPNGESVAVYLQAGLLALNVQELADNFLGPVHRHKHLANIAYWNIGALRMLCPEGPNLKAKANWLTTADNAAAFANTVIHCAAQKLLCHKRPDRQAARRYENSGLCEDVIIALVRETHPGYEGNLDVLTAQLTTHWLQSPGVLTSYAQSFIDLFNIDRLAWMVVLPEFCEFLPAKFSAAKTAVRA